MLPNDHVLLQVARDRRSRLQARADVARDLRRDLPPAPGLRRRLARALAAAAERLEPAAAPRPG